MNICNIINKYDDYNTKYFVSITYFVNSLCLHKINDSFLNVMCTNIRSVKANFDELVL